MRPAFGEGQSVSFPEAAARTQPSRDGRFDGPGRCRRDNAARESFFGLLQNNVLNRRQWATREELRIAIVTWTERTHHRRRRQQRLGELTPIEEETMLRPAVIQAAQQLSPIRAADPLAMLNGSSPVATA